MCRRYVGCSSMYVGCYTRRVGYYIIYALCTGVMWAATSSMSEVTASMYDVHVQCGLFHPLTLTLTIIKVQYRARKPNPTTVAATRRKNGWLRLL